MAAPPKPTNEHLAALLAQIRRELHDLAADQRKLAADVDRLARALAR
ncbi:MAG: hypothetical protein PVI35_04940 [Acidimicrobiia bacterium]|jgi:hypothetical protein